MTIYLTRHAESIFNTNSHERILNCSLSSKGRCQSKLLHGSYDLVILSPLKRAIQTFEESQITTKYIIIDFLFRERRTDICDYFPGEKIIPETEHEILDRVKTIKEKLVELNAIYPQILILGHGDLFWYLTSYEIKGERFGKWLDNTQMMTYMGNEIIE